MGGASRGLRMTMSCSGLWVEGGHAQGLEEDKQLQGLVEGAQIQGPQDDNQ